MGDMQGVVFQQRDIGRAIGDNALHLAQDLVQHGLVADQRGDGQSHLGQGFGQEALLAFGHQQTLPLCLRSLLLLNEAPLLEHPFDHGGQQFEIPTFQVLDNVIARAQLHGLHCNLLTARASDHDRRRHRLFSGSQDANHFQASVDGHMLISGHHIVGASFVHGQALFTVTSNVHDVTRPLQPFLEETGQTGIVLHVQDTDRFGFGHNTHSPSGMVTTDRNKPSLQTASENCS